MADVRTPQPRNAALAILATVALGLTMKWLAPILTPLALAIFLAVMIDGLTRVLRERLPRLNRKAALLAALILSVTVFAVTVTVVGAGATDFVTRLIEYQPKIDALLAQVGGLIGGGAPLTLKDAFDRMEPTRYLGALASGLQAFGSDAIFVLIYLGFIIAARGGFQRKIVALFPDNDERRDAVEVFHRIRSGIESYLWVQTVTGVIIAVASWLAMMAVGLENAVFWAFLIFIASYIPIVGGIVGVAFPPLFALLQFDGWWQGVVLFAVLQTVQFVVGNVIQPRMQGESLNIDPVAVLLALAFWGVLWGVAGMFLSTPLTVMAMIILAQFQGSKWLAILLSADGRPLGREKVDDEAPPPQRPRLF